MQSRVLRWSVWSRWATAVVLAAGIPACDSAIHEGDVALRSAEVDDEGGEPQPDVIEEIKGGVVSDCRGCGSHWTIVDKVDKKVVVVHLATKLGDGVLDLSDIGYFFYEGTYGFVKTDDAIPHGDGYSLVVHRSFEDASKAPEPDSLSLGSAILRLKLEDALVDIRLQYRDNATHEVADPPAFK